MPKPIKMPAPDPASGNTYARGMSAVLRYLGTDVTYDQVMGLSGVAFILQVDTSGPYVGEELDCAWWPNDAWGFELGLPMLAKGVGRDIRQIRCDWDAYRADPAAEYRRALAPTVEQSLRDGKPVLAKISAGFVITDTDDQDPPVLGYGTSGKSTQSSQDAIRAERYPWGVYIVCADAPAGDAAEIDLASLRHIIAIFNEEARTPAMRKTRFSGRQAWAEWLRLLRAGTESACDNNMLIHLRYNRGSAVAYLREMVKRHTGEASARISSAADILQRILDDLMEQPLPYGRIKKGEDQRAVHAEYTDMVERVSKLEAQAITELEAAAAILADKP
ncbi:hypothetical protein ACFLSJ_02370 [Verrucomicrobiota bacterium]